MNTESSNLGCFFSCTLWIMFILYFIIGFFMFAEGIMDANYVSRCKDARYNKITYYSGLKYAHKLGCYLGEDVDEN